jgi:hypothetical protein
MTSVCVSAAFGVMGVFYMLGRGKCKQSPYGPGQAFEGCTSSRLQEFLDNQHKNVADLSAIRTGHIYPPGDIPVNHLC